MGKRLNDTASISGPAKGGANVNHTVSCRKISNGYVVSTSSYNDGTGEYRSSEQFMSSPPRIIPGKVIQGGSPDGASTMSDCARYLREKG